MSSFKERLTIAKRLRSTPKLAGSARTEQAKNWLANTYPQLQDIGGYYALWLYQETQSLGYLGDSWVQEKRAVKAERKLEEVRKNVKALLTFANPVV